MPKDSVQIDREIKVITDSNGHVKRWICTECSWTGAPPANLTPESLRTVFAVFDQHDCEAYREKA